MLVLKSGWATSISTQTPCLFRDKPASMSDHDLLLLGFSGAQGGLEEVKPIRDLTYGEQKLTAPLSRKPAL